MPASRSAPLRHATLLLALAVLSPVPAAGQGPPSAAGWVVRRDPFAELWFEGLARIGGARYGPFGLYAPARPPAPGSALARVAPALRIVMAGDGAYDVLHFVPLYFVGDRPDAALDALRGALADDARGGAAGPARRAAAVAAALPGAARRAQVRALVDALDAQWREDVRSARDGPGLDAATLVTLQRRWDADLDPALAPFLAAVRRERGVIVPVAAIGLEGRIVRVEDGRNVIAVAGGTPGDTITPLLAAVRELGFALLDRTPAFGAPPASARAGDRLAAQRERDVAALRAGDMLLDRLAPSWARPYRLLYGGPGAATAAQFARAFPLAPSDEAALQAAVADIAGRGAVAAGRP